MYSSVHLPEVEQMLAGLSCQVSEPVTGLVSCNPLCSASAQVAQCRCEGGAPQPLVLNSSLVHHTPKMQKGQNTVLSYRECLYLMTLKRCAWALLWTKPRILFSFSGKPVFCTLYDYDHKLMYGIKCRHQGGKISPVWKEFTVTLFVCYTGVWNKHEVPSVKDLDPERMRRNRSPWYLEPCF